MNIESQDLRYVYDELKKLFKRLCNEFKAPPIIIIINRFGRKYIVSSMDWDNCLKGNCLFYSAYYTQNEVPNEKNQFYAVALPTELYAGIELHAELPKNLKNEYIHINNKLGFKR